MPAIKRNKIERFKEKFNKTKKCWEWKAVESLTFIIEQFII